MHEDEATRLYMLSSARYRATLACIADGVISTDPQGRVDFMNPEAERLTGWAENEAREKPLAEVLRAVDGETQAPVENLGARALRLGQTVEFTNHTVLITRDGTQRAIAGSGAPIRDESGATMGVVLVFRDQTAELRTRKALQISEAFNRTLVESIPQNLFLKDRNGVYLAVNAPYATSLGCKPEQLVGKDDFAFYPSELAEKYQADDRAVMESGQVKDIEEQFFAEGKEYWVHTIKAPVRDTTGQVTAVLGIFEDITERKRAEQSLEQARDRLAEAQRAAHLGNWEWDAVNDLITGSDEFYRLFEVAPEGITRFAQFVERLHPDDRERVQRDVADALRRDRPYDTDGCRGQGRADGGHLPRHYGAQTRRSGVARKRTSISHTRRVVTAAGLDLSERRALRLPESSLG